MRKTSPIFMPFAWVKNVYSLRTDSGMNSGYIKVSYTPLTSTYLPTRVQVLRFTQLNSLLSAGLSTLKMSFQPLLITDLYPVSTVPTIKKKKEIKERNS
ncbi:MAG: hypothetical protein JWO54_170 [Candidatus Saccharibacteria bacterium]|nr:hypothetical protein [Candidatus Saccharibacteria bacterium]MDB5180412.1 hypothetical protein [Candidatus Saccharibacteria bacterium]